jgi:hypothetical protein
MPDPPWHNGFRRWTDDQLRAALQRAGSQRGAYRLLTGTDTRPSGRFVARCRAVMAGEPSAPRPLVNDSRAETPEATSFDGVRQYATPEQAAAIDALLAHGSVLAAADALDVAPSRLRSLLSEAKRRASRAGWSPSHGMTHTVPGGYHVAGVSTYYGPDGEARGQWVKASADPEHKIARLLDALQTITEPLRGKATLTEPPPLADSDLLAAYLVGDPHFGMFAWEAETGESFDLKIAEATLTAAIDDLVGRAPPAEQALIVNVGDFFHTDNASNRTARSGNVLDVDTRWAKVLSVGVRAMRWCIDRALQKHARVRVINEIGNHDDHTAIVLSTVLAAFTPGTCITRL